MNDEYKLGVLPHLAPHIGLYGTSHRWASALYGAIENGCAVDILFIAHENPQKQV